MPIEGKYLFMVSMDVTAEKEALFNEVYDKEHVPFLLTVPGVLSVSRAKTVPAATMIGGERKTLDGSGEPNYTALYELESPDVLLSPNGRSRSRRAAGQPRCVPTRPTATMCCAS